VVAVRTVVRGADRFEVGDTPGADWGFWDLFADGRWEPQTFAVMDRYLTPVSTYVDVGAWVGPTVLYAARRCARVVAVEPDPVACADLLSNLAANGVENVDVVAGAVAATTGTVRLHARDGWGSSMSSIVGDGDETIEVYGISWHDLVAGYRNVALVKVDIEGGEALVLPAVAHWCAVMATPLLLSLHEPWWPPGAKAAVDGTLACFGHITELERAGGFVTVLGEP
jgi:FkbM family methyltransferase